MHAESISIRDVAEMLQGQTQTQPLHRHDFYFLLALSRGAGQHDIDFVSHAVRHHTVFVMRPGQVHQQTLASTCTGYLLQFPRELFAHDPDGQRLLRTAARINAYHLEPMRFVRIEQALARMLQEYTHQERSFFLVMQAMLRVVLIELTRSLTTPVSQEASAQHDVLELFNDLLTKHIRHHKSVAFYADRLHRSAFQLNALTKTLLGKTCSAVISDYVVLEARRQLLATNLQVNEIAARLGYDDPSYFIRFFRKHTGQSPEQFRIHHSRLS